MILHLDLGTVLMFYSHTYYVTNNTFLTEETFWYSWPGSIADLSSVYNYFEQATHLIIFCLQLKRKRECKDDDDQDAPLNLSTSAMPVFPPFPFYGLAPFPFYNGCHGVVEPKRTGSIAALRLKAREHEAAMEMLFQYKWYGYIYSLNVFWNVFRTEQKKMVGLLKQEYRTTLIKMVIAIKNIEIKSSCWIPVLADYGEKWFPWCYLFVHFLSFR